MNQTANIPRAEYPRPLLVRDRWLNLNGAWRFAVDPDNAGRREGWQRRELPGTAVIQVPFAPNSAASGIHDCPTHGVIWYQRAFEVPASWLEGGCRLRLGAVDHKTQVFVNGEFVGEHSGGYAPFAFELRDYLQPGTNQISIRVEDSLSWTQPRGKQAGTTRWPIDYDGVIGIWQTVWLEPVPTVSIESVCTRFDLQSSTLTCQVDLSHQVEGHLRVELRQDDKTVAEGVSEVTLRAETRVSLSVDAPVLWSPDQPYLYDLRLTLEPLQGEQDVIKSYCGLREITTNDGQLLLNQEPLYLRGVLDQGYFPEGWYTAVSDADYRQDIEITLAMGFNCVRKHQKAEDPRFLYWADRLGLLVWAEMPSGRIFSTELVRLLADEWADLIVRDRGHPSVVTWVAFNESWGVWHQSERAEQRSLVESMVSLTRTLDPSRPVVGNDGWEFSQGDLWTLHVYEEGDNLSDRVVQLMDNPGIAVTEGENGLGRRIGALPGASVTNLPILLTECGGFGFGTHGSEDFSYGELPETTAELEARIRSAVAVIRQTTTLQGYVWTQLTDVQQEVNGLLYFDRSPKLPLTTLRDIFGDNA